MSAYRAFAAYYDRLTREIDYPGRAAYFDRLIRQHLPVDSGTILLDLACGTGSLSVEFSKLGYDVIGVDASPDMLAEAQQKPATRPVLYLCQTFQQLDLYGTVDVAVCALDSLNHITRLGELEQAVGRVSLFTAPGGLLLFDVNTPYKHREVLGNNTFVYDLDDLYCVWQNTTDRQLRTRISLDFFVRRQGAYYRESERFYERGYTREQLEGVLARTGYQLLAVYGADTQQPLGETDQRAVYLARKL